MRGAWTMRWTSAAGLAALIAISVSPLACDRHPLPAPPAGTPAAAGAHAANLDVTLKDADGKDVRLDQFKGQPILLNFWATWCGPCKAEMPDIVAVSREYQAKGLKVIGVSIDDTPADVRKFAADNKIPYLLLTAAGQDDWLDHYNVVSGIPVTVFVRRDGTISDLLQAPGALDYFQRQARALF